VENSVGTNDRDKPVFVAGATGYVGSRLVPRLLEAGYQVRCLGRDRRKLAARSWSERPGVECVEGDAGGLGRLAEAMSGCGAAYYLIQQTEARRSRSGRRDAELARNFARAAEEAKLQRIVYLGRLAEEEDSCRALGASRRPVERVLASGRCPVTALRAALIIGSGSASFEVFRSLAARSPMVIMPHGVMARRQPIGIANVLHYLVACLETPQTVGRTLEIGGADVVTCGELVRLTADALDLRRRTAVPLPLLTPRTSSLWMHLLTPVTKHVAHRLAQGLRKHLVCRDDHAAQLMPQPLLTAREAIAAAVREVRTGEVESAWTWAGLVPPEQDWLNGRMYHDRRTAIVEAHPQRVFETVCRIGGRQGYYAANWLWQVRGWMDRLVGGPGLHRGRCDPNHVAFADVIDFWRVSRMEPGERLQLRAEMRLPGEGVLEFEVSAGDRAGDTTKLTQTAIFEPRGLAGMAYWHAIMPLHGLVLGGMIDGIRRAAEEAAAAAGR
jgi:uncharacterized protein YbjT (DUF2867 family)